MEVQNSKSPQGSTAALFSLPQPPVDFSGAQNDPEIDQISAVDSASAPKQPETPASSNSIEMVSTVQVLTEQEVEEQEIHAAKLVNHLWDSLTHNVAYETCTDDEDGGGGGSNMHGSIIHGSNMHAVHGTYGDRRPQSLPNPPMDAMHGVHGMQGKLGIHAMHNRREEVLEGFGWAVCSGLKSTLLPNHTAILIIIIMVIITIVLHTNGSFGGCVPKNHNILAVEFGVLC